MLCDPYRSRRAKSPSRICYRDAAARGGSEMIPPLPDYWLPRPAAPLDRRARAACDRLLTSALAQGANPLLADTLPVPKWQFLCYLAEHHAIVLHGSGNQHITRFEPRQPVDLNAFGKQRAVYAAADGIWA